MFSSISCFKKTYLLGSLLLMNILLVNYPLKAESKNNIRAEEETKMNQIMTYYKEGKKEMKRKNYLAAIVSFKHVIELEKDFHIIYSPYAQQFIQEGLDKIKEKEEKELANPTVEKKEENITVDTATITSPQSPAPTQANTTTKTSDYTIGEDDILYISVWQNKDLDQEVIVRPDGKISFFLIGDIQAVGLTVPQLDEEITQRLKEYIKYPEVSITLRKIGGKKVIILGEVSDPGVYNITGKKTILELIALANGFTKDAVLSSVIVIRGGFQNPKGKRINLVRAIEKGDLKQNIVIEPEDIVYVPKTFISNVSYVMTQILSPISQGIYTTQTLHHW